MSLFTESVEVGNVTVLPDPDEFGNDVTEFQWVDSVAWLEQVNSTENDDNQQQTVWNMRLYVPLDTVIDRTSKVRYGGHEWDVNGQPGRQPGGFIVEGFQLAVLTREEG